VTLVHPRRLNKCLHPNVLRLYPRLQAVEAPHPLTASHQTVRLALVPLQESLPLLDTMDLLQV
jgi:hypothetical protein